MGNRIGELSTTLILNTLIKLQNYYGNEVFRSGVSKIVNRADSIIFHIYEFKEEQYHRFGLRKRNVFNKDFTYAKSVWPISTIKYLFLPEFAMRMSSNYEFKFVSLIAKGAFGKVFKVKDIKTEKIYAMKILEKSQVIEEKAIYQVKDEIKIQSLCGHHKFIVKCLLSWQTRSQLFIVSEYKTGGELLQLIKMYGPLHEDLVRIYVAELAVAIDFLHNAGIIHRDLKPENILLDEEQHICLTDFGLSKWLSIGCRTGTICGTPQYMAPEITQFKLYSHAVDWWSLGIITCLLLTKEFPKITEMETQLPETIDVSVASRDLLLRLLTYDPTKRLRSLYTLKTIAFFKNFNFKDVLDGKINPKELLQRHNKIENENETIIFNSFNGEH